MKKLLLIVVSLCFSIATMAQNSSYYYQKAQQAQKEASYHEHQYREAMKWAESYQKSAANASTPAAARNFAAQAQGYRRQANNHYYQYQQAVKKYYDNMEIANRLAQQGR